MNEAGKIDIHDLHWLMDILQSVDAGIVVLDSDMNIQVWNSFMENHSGLSSVKSIGSNILELFPEIPAKWFQRKMDTVLMLNTQAFSAWEQRPYLFKFKNYRPITGKSEFMYQNITFMPLASTSGQVTQVGIIVYDVTDIATNKLDLEDVNNQLQTLSRTDALTQLNNRGFWEECLNMEFARCNRTKRKSTLIMFDIDHFKKVNDTYGHQAGDEVIKTVSRILQETIRTTDVAGRYGGEEFGILLIDTDENSSMFLAERLRKKIESQIVKYEDFEISFTISLGIAEFDDSLATASQWLERSDQALYHSKESGRNQATIYGVELKLTSEA